MNLNNNLIVQSIIFLRLNLITSQKQDKLDSVSFDQGKPKTPEPDDSSYSKPESENIKEKKINDAPPDKPVSTKGPKDLEKIVKNYAELENYRKTQGIGAYSIDSGDTVAGLKVGDETIFGVNSSITPEMKLAAIDQRRKWFNEISWCPPKTNPPKHLGYTQSLSHAEAHSIMQAYEKYGDGLPKSLVMTVDRTTCGICMGELPIVLRHVGVDELKIFSGGSNTAIIIKAAK